MTRIAILFPAILVFTACAVRLGGPKPEEYNTLAIETPADFDPPAVAALVQRAGAEIVLLTAPRDSAWFEELSRETGLALSGPGSTESPAKAFLTNLEILGDTSIVLGVGDGSRMHMHDALYEISEGRLIDLMLVGVSEQSDLREAARTLLSYIASDVGANAAIMMAIDAPSTQAADSMAILLRAAYSTAGECAIEAAQDGNRGSLRLYYGPSARVRCRAARFIGGPGAPVIAELIVGR